MKKLITLLLLIAFVSCKTDQGEPLTGDFVYYADAAVFQVGNDIHGVILNDKVEDIAKQAKAFQKEPTDMVKIEVLGELIPKAEQEEGWPYKLKINKVISVSALESNRNDVIKLGK
ncbi:hypothetical protein [Olleya aquimaris]|uniref:NlpE C-terminal OB domain-containing protein n=1 Tax=Olleya aquimaris TaxID=639310 RepID=A0A327RLV9_9FLAO|nr:hypothetical protein [Olleya aquimaris]RAJ18046.1 hypothetical protein LY08_00319 [Olleya aquimaris]